VNFRPAAQALSSRYAVRYWPPRRSIGHVQKGRIGGLVAGAAERDEAGGHECCLVDGRLVAFLEPPREPSRGDAGVPPRILHGDQRGELQRLGEADAADFPQRGLRDEKVASLDRSLKDRPRMALAQSCVPFRGRRRHDPTGCFLSPGTGSNGSRGEMSVGDYELPRKPRTGDGYLVRDCSRGGTGNSCPLPASHVVGSRAR
jgi:hypothetical protein